MVALLVLILISVISLFFKSSRVANLKTYLIQALIFDGLTKLILDAYYEFLISGYFNYIFPHSEPLGELISIGLAYYSLFMTLFLIPVLIIIVVALNTE